MGTGQGSRECDRPAGACLLALVRALRHEMQAGAPLPCVVSARMISLPQIVAASLPPSHETLPPTLL